MSERKFEQNRFEKAQSHFAGCVADYKESSVVVFGAPFDGAAGSALPVPARLREGSSCTGTYSPYQDVDLADLEICDAGDLDLCSGDETQILGQIGGITKYLVKAGKRPVMIGGGHLVSLPAIRAVYLKHQELRVLYFDAHAGLLDEYLGRKLSHMNVVRRAWDILGDGKIFQFGVRSGTRGEFEWSRSGHTRLCGCGQDELARAAEKIGGAPVYVSVDLDVLDPSVFPATAMPEAGGMTFNELLSSILALRGLDIVAADIVGFLPCAGAAGLSEAAACKVLRELLIAVGRR